MKRPQNPHKKGSFAYQAFNTQMGYIFNGENRPTLKNLKARSQVLKDRANDLNTNWKAGAQLTFEAGCYDAVIAANF
jgi:hypothetical protein|tara:strand:- start:3551 stop:3781 length:231 start_codon:yes stop_codon:yes gene_type:complete